MRIGMILLSKFPPDIRVEKELNTLRVEHDVFMLCPRRGEQLAKEIRNGMEIQRVFTQVERRWSHWCLMATCYSKGWEREINRYIRENQLDVLHVHDLPLVRTALNAAKRHGIPVVADFHENYPAMLQEDRRKSIFKVTSAGSLISRFAVSIKKWKAYENSVISRVSALIVVVDEARERLLKINAEIPKVYVVPNYSSKTVKTDQNEGGSERDITKTDFRIVYAGGFDETRDLATVVNAVKRLERSEVPNLKVVLIGGTGRSFAAIQQHVEQTGNQDRIHVCKWMDIDAVENIVGEAHVGLVPHVKSEHTDSTIPHKLFQYMVRRLPVIVSNCAPLERIVTSSSCGMIYRSGDSQSLAVCIKDMYQNPWLAKRMGAAGYHAVQEKYNWESAGKNLLAVYKELRG